MAGARDLGVGRSCLGGLTEGYNWVKVYSSDGELVSGVMLVGLCRGGEAVIDVVYVLMAALS